MTAETVAFQTEAKQLLELMIHSVYSNKDIFLRELISNSSDALDKRRFEALQAPDLLEEGTDLHIFLEANKEARTLSVSDNGIGMNRDEVREHIGTIAKSGTKEFINKLKEGKSENSVDLIGQFGVGFYSTFMVADSVELITRKAGEKHATKWVSSGEGTYTLEDAERSEAGTTVTLHLKAVDTEDGLQNYADEWVIRKIVKQYSDFVSYPIRMEVERDEYEYDEEGKPKEGVPPKKVTEAETLNSMKAIWLRDKKEVTDEEYNEFYKHISHDWTDPMLRIQAQIEGMLEYRCLLYVPTRAPFDLFYQNMSRKGVQLYVKRVFIMDECQALIPDYLRFIKGVVDSEDLSLNISREILQQNRQIERMRKGIIGKVLDRFLELQEKEPEQYLSFWREFGRALKEGIFQDTENHEKLLKLLMTHSTMMEGETLTSLQGYLDRMKDGQDTIYYMTGEDRAKVAASPHLEAFADKGIEVLIFCDPVDEVWLQMVYEFEGKQLVSAGKGEVDLGDDADKEKAEEERKAQKETYGSLLECLKKNIEAHVSEVRLSNRLRSSSACLVSGPNDITPQMEQMMRAMGQNVPPTKRILELNPDHDLVKKLQAAYEANKDDPRLAEYAELLYGQALLAEGGSLQDPARFSRLLADLMTRAV